ncbi:MAG: metal ABC transporter substrate-binding protein [Chitinivibrionia bacterium]|nr:metal ABC transporter substrate-binding protein [Chitinivibrionia bacterium]
MNFARFFLSLLFLFLSLYGKPLVIVSVYPLYDFVSVIAENEVSLQLIVSPNNDPHSFEPTPKDAVNISKADLFFYISPDFEPWAQKFAQKAKLAVFFADDKNHICDESDEHNHDTEQNDPHIWLNIEESIEIIERICVNLVKILPEKKVFFEKNAQELIMQLKNLDSQYSKIFEKCKDKKVFFAGHNSFLGFAQNYDLQFVAITQSFSSSAEPSPKQIAKIIDEIRESKSKFIFYDALKSGAVAKTIAKETGVEILPLFSVHSISKDDFAKKIGFVEYMRRNYENLTKGLKCPQ